LKTNSEASTSEFFQLAIFRRPFIVNVGPGELFPCSASPQIAPAATTLALAIAVKMPRRDDGG
jgi:hypothetical protein